MPLAPQWQEHIDVTPAEQAIDYTALQKLRKPQARRIIDAYIAALTPPGTPKPGWEDVYAQVEKDAPALAPLLGALHHLATGISAGGSARGMDESDRNPLKEAHPSLMVYLDSDHGAELLALPLYRAIASVIPDKERSR